MLNQHDGDATSQAISVADHVIADLRARRAATRDPGISDPNRRGPIRATCIVFHDCAGFCDRANGDTYTIAAIAARNVKEEQRIVIPDN